MVMAEYMDARIPYMEECWQPTTTCVRDTIFFLQGHLVHEVVVHDIQCPQFASPIGAKRARVDCATGFQTRLPQVIACEVAQKILVGSNVEDSQLGTLGYSSILGKCCSHIVTEARLCFVVAAEHRTLSVDIVSLVIVRDEIVIRPNGINTGAHTTQRFASSTFDSLSRVVQRRPCCRSGGVGTMSSLFIIAEPIRRDPGIVIRASGSGGRVRLDEVDVLDNLEPVNQRPANSTPVFPHQIATI